MIQTLQILMFGLTALALGVGPAFCPCPKSKVGETEMPACHATGSKSSSPCHDSDDRDTPDQNRFCCQNKTTPIASTDKLSVPMTNVALACPVPEPVEMVDLPTSPPTLVVRSTHGAPGVPRTLLSLGCLLTI